MQLHHNVLSVIAGAVALQFAPCQAQSMVSMSVTSAIGTVGQACEPFQCLPHQTLAYLGEGLAIEVFGLPEMPYILFAGTPTIGCLPILGLSGELAVWAPIITLQLGFVSNNYVGDCGVAVSTMSCTVPVTIPLGMQLRLQSIAMAPKLEQPAFSRAIEVHTR